MKEETKRSLAIRSLYYIHCSSSFHLVECGTQSKRCRYMLRLAKTIFKKGVLQCHLVICPWLHSTVVCVFDVYSNANAVSTQI